MFGQAEPFGTSGVISHLAGREKEEFILSKEFQNKLRQTRTPSAKVMSYSTRDTNYKVFCVAIYDNM